MFVAVLISLFLQSQVYAATASITERQLTPVVHPVVGHTLPPKSVNIHPDQNKFYVNCLEESKTIVYCVESREKLKVVKDLEVIR